MKYPRRQFLQYVSIGMGTLLLRWKSAFASQGLGSTMKIGIVADVHKDIMYDADRRLAGFMEACDAQKPDLILQLGDFCFPIDKNKDFFRLWNDFQGPKLHVLGNHDMDVSNKTRTIEYWEMPHNYYSFDQGGFHFVILDANYLYREGKFLDYDNANFYVDDGYRTFVHPDQIDWLREDLKQTVLPTLIFSHQGLANDFAGVKNRLEIQQVFEQENQRVGYQKVVACFNGHNHIDFHRRINDIHYVNINSMSYKWVGEAYENRTRYEASIYETHPSMAYIIPYEEPLFAFLDIDTAGTLSLTGTRTRWVAPSPEELEIPPTVMGNEPHPHISDRKLLFTTR